MKIAVLASSYPRFEGDGAAPFVRSICEHLVKAGNQVEVVAPFDPLVKEDQQGSVPVHRFRYIWPDRWSIMGHARSLDADVHLNPISYLLLPVFLFFAFSKLMTVTKKQHSDVIYVHWVLPNGPVGSLVAALRGIPFIISLHGSDIYLAKKYRLMGSVARQVFRRALGVTACSQELQQAALSLGAPSDTLLLAWGADPEIFSPARCQPDFRKSLELPESDVLLLAIGRMVFKKGFEILLKSMPEVLAACPNTHLILAGDGVLKTELEKLAANLRIFDHVTFTGRVPWNLVPGYLASVDIFVLPSVRDNQGNIDGLPTVLPEAMAAGAAVIASNIGGVNLVIADSENGLLVPPGDVQSLAQALISLIQNKTRRELLGLQARESVIQEFNWEHVAVEITKLMKKANTN